MTRIFGPNGLYLNFRVSGLDSGYWLDRTEMRPRPVFVDPGRGNRTVALGVIPVPVAVMTIVRGRCRRLVPGCSRPFTG
ncbi:hypothetical protein SBA4_590010 [Candidatus Sulfopaludibacter sp. SbA4]|nr:hypothetical protein SBA4_590010 [Candidatus Sulfopaludibacter sp. SbA4]